MHVRDEDYNRQEEVAGRKKISGGHILLIDVLEMQR